MGRTAFLVALVLVVSVSMGSAQSELQRLNTRNLTIEAHTEARGDVVASASLATRMLAGLAPRVTEAQRILDDSTGRVLSEHSRGALELVLQDLDVAAASTRQHITAALAAAAVPAPEGATVGQIGESTTALGAKSVDDRDVFIGLQRELGTTEDAVEADVVLWTEQQHREAVAAATLTAAAAAADVAQQAAAQLAAEAAANPPGNAPAARAPVATIAVPAPVHIENVWASGFQAEIDACRGSVDLTASYGLAVIGEHWTCGGSEFPRTEGSIVQLTGVRSGTYRTGPVVAVLNEATDGAEDLPRGYDLMYQTCINDSNAQMSFTVLTRIG